MSTLTITPDVVEAPVMPEVNFALGEQIGDEILLGAVSLEKVGTVKATGNGRGIQSHNARAWTMSGNVD